MQFPQANSKHFLPDLVKPNAQVIRKRFALFREILCSQLAYLGVAHPLTSPPQPHFLVLIPHNRITPNQPFNQSQVGNVGFAETNSPTGPSTNQSQGWGGFQGLPNQAAAGAGGGYVEGGDIHNSNAVTMSPSDRQYCSQIYGQPGTGVHPSFTPPANQYIEPAAPPQPISVSTIPPEQKPKELELDEELYFWLVDQVRRFPSYPQWSDEVCKDDRVNSNPDLVTSILMSEDFFRSLEKKAKEG